MHLFWLERVDGVQRSNDGNQAIVVKVSLIVPIKPLSAVSFRWGRRAILGKLGNLVRPKAHSIANRIVVMPVRIRHMEEKKDFGVGLRALFI